MQLSSSSLHLNIQLVERSSVDHKVDESNPSAARIFFSFWGLKTMFIVTWVCYVYLHLNEVRKRDSDIFVRK